MNSTDKNDAFRLGCYAAAKHAGATHDEAVDFVVSLDHKADAGRAWRLGVYKTAKEAGATDDEALAFTNEMEKQAINLAPIGAGIAKYIGGAMRGVGNAAASLGQGMVGAPTRAMGAAQTKGLRAIDKLKPTRAIAAKGGKPAVAKLTRGDIRGQREAYLKQLQGQGYAIPGRGGKTPALATGIGAGMVRGMQNNAGLTGAGVTGLGLYGGAKMLGGGAAPAQAPAASGERMSNEEILALLAAIQGGGQHRRSSYGGYGY
jgi:hypothetical protein